jgi:hypothetical protein
MTIDQFWNLIGKVHHESNGDFDRKCELLEAELRKLPLDEVRSFDAHFTECQDRAYTWKLWGAAYVMGGGCSDDGFSDFRSTLISLGREVFERALVDPESLADVADDELQYEGFQYVAPSVAQDLSGGENLPRSRPHPKDPSGQSWDENEVAGLYPRLAEKFDFE